MTDLQVNRSLFSMKTRMMKLILESFIFIVKLSAESKNILAQRFHIKELKKK